MGKFKEICHLCGGKGKKEGCPRCGLALRDAVVVQTMQLDVPVDLIPQAYQGKLWVKPESSDSIPLKFREFDNSLDKLKNEFLAGRIPKFSVFLSTPPKYGKHDFAFTCMQTALVQRYSVAPLLSTSDWRRLYRVSQMNPFYKLYDKYKWDDLVSRDVVFLTVDHSDDRFDVISLLKDILDTRASFGKPTFILSDYKLTELTSHWNANNYNLIYNPIPDCDHNRYPYIMQRWE